MTETDISIKKGTIKKIMKKQGRTSEGAVDALHKFMNEFMLNVIAEATKAQEHAGRKTLTSEDIDFVAAKYRA